MSHPILAAASILLAVGAVSLFSCAVCIAVTMKGAYRFASIPAFVGAIAVAFGAIVTAQQADASTQRIPFEWEREIGREKITPIASTALNVPNGATHAEFRIAGGDVFVRTDGGTVNDAATTSTADAATMWDAFSWAEGHHRKEENDGPMLSAMRFKCAACTVWVSYRARRGAGQ